MSALWIVALVSAAIAFSPITAGAEPVTPGSPTEAVRRHIDAMLVIAGDPRLTADGRRDAARDVIARTFDFGELSRRALGEHWSRLKVAERADVTGGLHAMVTAAYASQLRRDLGPHAQGLRDRVRFLGESVSVSTASVSLSLLHAGRDVPLQVALVRRGREWRIWDLAVQGIRLTDNLGAQVAHLSRGGDYGAVVERFRARQPAAVTAMPAPASGTPSHQR